MQNWPGDKELEHTLVCLFGLMLNAPMNSYGHVETVSSSNHTFSPGQACQYFVHILSLLTDSWQSEWKKKMHIFGFVGIFEYIC